MESPSDAPEDTGDIPALMRLRTRQLLLAARLGEEQHLGRAASAMGISQPAATRLLREMEHTLGMPLFERSARGMRPTAGGQILIRYARQVLHDFAATRRELAAVAAGLDGALRVGSVPSALPHLVAPAIARFKTAHPRVIVTVTVATSDVLVPQLAHGQADVALGRLSEAGSDVELEAEPVLEEPQRVVLRRSHPLARGARPAGLPLQELTRWPWAVQPPGSPQHGRFLAMMRELGAHRLDITETASTIATTALLANSDMLAIMPASLAAHYGSLGVLAVLPIDLPMHVPAIHLIRRRGREHPPAVDAFVDEVRAAAGGMVSG